MPSQARLIETRGEVVLLGGEFVFQMRVNADLATRPGLCGKNGEGAAGAAGAIDGLFVEKEKIVGIVVNPSRGPYPKAGPAVANAMTW